ncbi:REP element-mobilizing transposase RayT [Desulforamulus aeronauticus DSM 10349]|uniref:REP element-mobilizing transposase RayT n=2 Tax=Desulforamulus aeronauticus TaxID=53343 RepID=A0A1M6VGI5_9FIRM|nr:REP element-mobilizing transposase RayT [Desulforamulus aeronauticus DSM 10349]
MCDDFCMNTLAIRKPNRLMGYDYSQNGAYFITICVKDRRELLWNVGATFGRPLCDHKHLSKYEEIYHSSVIIDKYVIMPNHVHMLIVLKNDDLENGRPKVAPTISRIIQQFKGSISKQIGSSIWQKLFHDHIIRNEQDYLEIWQYIDTNPIKWEEDCFYPKGTTNT